MTGDLPQPLLSVVIPTFNRRSLVQRSVDSAIAWRGTRDDIEIIIVDDGSTDGTLEELGRVYANNIVAGVMRLFRTPSNLGASGAKNFGALNARGAWLMFLDSDDMLIEASRDALLDELVGEPHAPMIFCRCLNMTSGALIGAASPASVTIDVRTYLAGWVWGECLPVVRRSAFSRYPYEAQLRGHEGIAYARMFKNIGPGRLIPLVVRRYDTSGEDRLSRRSALIARSRLLASGYRMTAREFSPDIGFAPSFALWARALVYGAIAFVSGMLAIARR